MNGVPCAVGDLVRVFHFRGRRGRKHFMYKLLMEIPSRRKGMVAVDVKELATLGKESAHCCSMAALGEFEIIDGSGGYGLEDWQDFRERPRVKTDEAKGDD